MTIGSKGDDSGKVLDRQGGGDSAGVPASGELEGNACHPLGDRPGLRHWQASFITRPGLDERSGVFFAAIEMTRMPMVITDPNQRDNPVVFINRAFLDLTSYEEAQVLGRNCRFLQGPQTDPETVAEIRTAVAERRAVAVDILNYKADGTPFWNALFVGPVFDPQGKLLYFFSSQVDITRRRNSEQAFRQAQKMEAIGQLTAGLAHDFNNLLQVITGNLELVAQRLGGDDEEVLRSVQHAQRAAERGGKLTQQLLAFARRQRLEPRQVNLNALVVEFSEMLARTLGAQVDLRLDLKPGLPACRLDPTQLEMALLNVLINARDAMPGGGRVTIATSLLDERLRARAHQLPPGSYVVLCVIDEGEGMTAEVARRATEPFFTTKPPGTGLGLAMVHGFAQQSHGRLELDSAPGRGTTVRMIFPVAAPPLPRPEEPGRGPGDAQGTILVVDDSDDVRHTAEQLLRDEGYHVLSASSGEAALELLEGHGRVELLFTDIIMPGGMNGLMLAERARQRLPGLPVLLTTGYADESGGPGGDPVLVKPYRRAELLERIRSALHASPATPAGAPAGPSSSR
ncbi:histidine kinase famiy protein [Azohydromonas caseinilytica]|uniref:histidine kinase n=1 Tax=Azohydromonas caseinilytica TaxID=2728836 RepID=A0A848F7J3_9BURK|nr:histidine kinase famiy protein [Azohydromonas caseinilytica]NML15544.1 PAS domain-containing protein [Azohydromonas caseinilytica]